MQRKTSSIDGFVPRRRYSGAAFDRPAASHNGLRETAESSNLTHASAERDVKGAALQPEADNGLTRSELDAALGAIESPEAEPKKKSRRKKAPTSKKKLVKRILITLGVAILLVAGYLGVIAIINGMSIFQGDLWGLTQSQPLKADANGRSNIVIFGTSEDDEGGNHPGAYLTDSILVASISQTKKDAFMFSIPRDLWVRYDGKACNAGYEGRINELYNCYANGTEDEKAGADALRKKIGEITGLDVQYYVHVNYSVVREAVDAVGGVEVTIESRDPRGILDRNFDWKCNRQCYYVKYPNGPTGIMDGEHALALARARGVVAPTYGLERSNYDREINQQKIMKALVSKAASAGTLTNVAKVSSLMSALGKNLRTNFETSEIRTLMSLGNDIDLGNVQSISLIDAEPAIWTNDQMSGASIVRPVDGFYAYTPIHLYLKKQLTSDAAVREAAAIGVYNGTATSGLAQTTADALTDKNLTVAIVGNAPQGKYEAYEVYDITGKKPATAERLAKLYGVTVKTTTPPLATNGLDFVVIIGKAPETETAKTE